MKNFRTQFAAAVTAALFGLATHTSAQGQPTGPATIHGHAQNPAGVAVASTATSRAEVKLTTDRNASATGSSFVYTFPVDANGNYSGTVDKPANYLAALFVQGNLVDVQGAPLTPGGDKTVDFDMTRKSYVDKMTPAERAAVEQYKKDNAANAGVENLNAMLKDARDAIKAGNFDLAIKKMTDATAAKADEAILWYTLGDAELGQADAAAKTAHDAKTTDATLPDKYGAAVESFKKTVVVNAAATKPNPALTPAANSQMALALGKLGRNKEAAAAYDAAAAADPAKATTYYYNEAATFLNASNTGSADAAAFAAAAADKVIAADPNRADAYYIKAEGLAPGITPSGNKFIAPPGLLEACNKYLELAPTGPHAEEMKGLIAGLGTQVQDTYKAKKK